MHKITVIFLVTTVFFLHACRSQVYDTGKVIPGAERTVVYFNYLADKNVALICNQSSLVGGIHLLDTLLHSDIHVTRVFSPEHGFRGNADAGAIVPDTIDPETGIGIISLYGSKKKPGKDDLKGIDILVFDIQDVGVRFYTYLTTLHYVMEACAENNLPLLVLDRPNPNGFFIDGPVLEEKFRSFVGMHKVPLVHGMTPGEYARMINSEGWLAESMQCDLKVISCLNYSHKSRVVLTTDPSPNIENMRAVYLYPSLGLLEGTVMNVGRGTDFPFQVIGHPDFPDRNFSYTPHSNEAAQNPKYKDVTCYGIDLRNLPVDSLSEHGSVNLQWLITTYTKMNLGGKFFTGYFDLLAGTDKLRIQILNNTNLDSIRNSWTQEIEAFKAVRKNYLLYPDFE